MKNGSRQKFTSSTKRPQALMLTLSERLSIRCDAMMAIGRNSRGHVPEMIAVVMEPDRFWFNQDFLRRTVIRPRIRSQSMFPGRPALSILALLDLSGVSSKQESAGGIRNGPHQGTHG